MKREKNIDFDLSQMKRVSPVPILNLPDIVEEDCYEAPDGVPYLVFACKPASRASQVCPSCGAPILSVHGYLPKRRLVHDVNIGITQIDLLVKVPRYRCDGCGATFAHKFESIPENKQVTHRLYEQIRRDVFVRPFTDVADDFGYTITTISTIFDEYAAELETKRGTIVAPRVLGIDEKHIVHAMRAVFVDIETGTLLEMTENNKKNDIVGTIESMVDYDKNIEIVTMDMSPGYRSWVQECLPDARIVVDKYHIYQDLAGKVKKTRTRILEYLKDSIKNISDPAVQAHMTDVYTAAANNQYLFKFGQEKLSQKASRLKTMADVCRTFPEFNHLRLLKEGFELIYDCTDRAAAEGVFAAWEELVPPRGKVQMEEWKKKHNVPPELYSEFRVFDRTINNWREEVFTYFEPGYKVTNAATEGLNNMIERFNRLGNGYSFARLRAKALLWHLAAPRYRCTLRYDSTSASATAKPPQTRMSGFVVHDADFFGLSVPVTSYVPPQPILQITEVDVVREPLSTFRYLPEDFVPY